MSGYTAILGVINNQANPIKLANRSARYTVSVVGV